VVLLVTNCENVIPKKIDIANKLRRDFNNFLHVANAHTCTIFGKFKNEIIFIITCLIKTTSNLVYILFFSHVSSLTITNHLDVISQWQMVRPNDRETAAT